MSCRQKVGKNITLHFQLPLPVKNKRVTTYNPRRNYVTVYFGLTPKQAQKLKKLAGEQQRTESEVLRDIIDTYLQKTDRETVLREPCRKTPPTGLKTLPRTILKQQDEKLRTLAEQSGRAISELVREAIKNLLD